MVACGIARNFRFLGKLIKGKRKIKRKRKFFLMKPTRRIRPTKAIKKRRRIKMKKKKGCKHPKIICIYYKIYLMRLSHPFLILFRRATSYVSSHRIGSRDAYEEEQKENFSS